MDKEYWKEGHLDTPIVCAATASSCQLGFLGASHGYCPVLSLTAKWIKPVGVPAEWSVEHICVEGGGGGEVIYQKASILSHYTLSTHLIHPFNPIHPSLPPYLSSSLPPNSP